MQTSQITYVEGEPTVVTVIHDGEIYTAIADYHPNFRGILAALGDGSDADTIMDLFDVQRAVSARFEVLTERVSVRDGLVYFDGDVVHSTLSDHIIRFLNEGVDDWQPLVFFMENVMLNPNQNSREQLFEWLANDESLTITDDGYIVGYKGCNIDSDGVYVSTRRAPLEEQVTVDGEVVEGFVRNLPDATIAMPRSFVDPAEANYCSVGLHVGTFRYAKSFAGNVLEVHVNPRDVVSVTSDSNREKIRTCRYEVVGPVEAQYTEPVVAASQVRRDTRDNHKAQERDQYGRFLPKQ